jgi:hypothetical protein
MYLFLKHSEGYVLCGNTIPFSEEKKEEKYDFRMSRRGGDDENGGDFHEFLLPFRTQNSDNEKHTCRDNIT